MRVGLLIFCLLAGHRSVAQSDSLHLLFLGDIMGHQAQMDAAQIGADEYDYSFAFRQIQPTLSEADFCIANLEVTLSGKPYFGYPTFSSPAALAAACRDSGIDVLLNANNHALDRGSRGLVRTIEQLDSLGIKHNGTFRSFAERQTKNLLILHHNNIRVGLLNYTESTNGIALPRRAQVNVMDTLQMQKDIARAQRTNIDVLLVFMHWGKEYEQIPTKDQKQIAAFLRRQGVDIVIGAHPHVLQPMEWQTATPTQKEFLIAYSLGNFISAQRTSGRDGGAMLHLTLVKENGNTHIAEATYELVWVYTPKLEKKRRFQVLPANDASIELGKNDNWKRKQFVKNANDFLQKNNHQVPPRNNKNTKN